METYRVLFYEKFTTKTVAEYPFGYEDTVKRSGYINAHCHGSTEIELDTVYAAELEHFVKSNQGIFAP